MVDAVSALASQQATSQEAASSAASKAQEENFSLFLSLLTTQLQNQDPLDPMDTSEMTSQLVQFSSVEQTIATNSNLEKLIALTSSQSSGTAVEYIGKQVEALATAARFTETAGASWRYSVSEDAPETTLSVIDSNGATVYTETISAKAGTHDFTWDGSLDDGGTASEGTYFLNLAAADAEGEPVATDVRISGIVNAVDFTADPPILMVNSIPVYLSDVTGVATPPDPDA
ncbi:MAG: flagellar hook assembly protein FlgD [Parvibaculaceae bacterium]